MVITNIISIFANMFLTGLTINGFRNISEASLEFSPGINCISGDNGAGKTNLLDAVYYLSMTKSFFDSSDRFVYQFGKDEAILCGNYAMEDGQKEKIAVSVRRSGEKIVKRGAKAYQRLSEHIGLLPVVMVSPIDISLINESGEERRKYMNFILSQTDKQYLAHIQAYNQLLAQRNKLLKEDSPSADLLEVMSERMASHAEYVYEARKELCVKLVPLVSGFYSRLSEDREAVSAAYRSDLGEATLDELFRREAARERILHYSTVGIQRDDISFLLGDHPIRKCGSQGQQKSFLLALKLAQFLFIKQIYGRTPILLLDDVFDKLDMGRVARLLEIVSSLDFGQIFITDCNKVRLDDTFACIGAPCKSFAVEGGAVSEI